MCPRPLVLELFKKKSVTYAKPRRKNSTWLEGSSSISLTERRTQTSSCETRSCRAGKQSDRQGKTPKTTVPWLQATGVQIARRLLMLSELLLEYRRGVLLPRMLVLPYFWAQMHKCRVSREIPRQEVGGTLSCLSTELMSTCGV